ncbi:unnamed protein product [Darwinula stevensoni]|uniref:Calnexin n=1 Tax=Darwinula stevensoni TaxID=69355 RepID=A0A7R9A5J0_9CRUS|nr:unnamed protein product [Darwinula stevensoni]CAG0892149.1 unnamed protein product [Darwinula stevensoni]
MPEVVDKVEDSREAADKVEDFREAADKVEDSREAADKVEGSREAADKVEDFREAADKVEDFREAVDKVEDFREAADKVEDSQEAADKVEDFRVVVDKAADSQVVVDKVEDFRVAVDKAADSQVVVDKVEDSVIMEDSVVTVVITEDSVVTVVITEDSVVTVVITEDLVVVVVTVDDSEDDANVIVDDEPAKEDVKIVDVKYETPKLKGSGPTYFADHFDDEKASESQWMRSQAKKDGVESDIAKYDGIWKVEAMSKTALPGDYGLVMKSKAKHSAISAKLDKPFVFDSNPLIVQYEVAFQNGLDCGGAYIKLLSKDSNLSLKNLHDKTPYTIMFGPDKCGHDSKLHFIFRHKNPLTGEFEEKHMKKPSKKLDDEFTDKASHLYTLFLYPDNSFEIQVDLQKFASGNLLETMDPPVNPPKEIEDPTDKKPDDWDEREKIPDPNAKKPDDWVEEEMILDESATMPDGWLEDEPTMIPDPDAVKPDDWDEDMDGDWEPPLIENPKCMEAPGCGEWKQPKIANPAYKGRWYPPMIDNPKYKGKWAPRVISNPKYFQDDHPFHMTTVDALGFELWSMSDNIYFDNILVTSDPATALAWAEDTWKLKQWTAVTTDGSLWKQAVAYTNKYPWLWAIYVLVFGLPIVLLITYCTGGSKAELDEIARRKKEDPLVPDDEGAKGDGDEQLSSDKSPQDEKEHDEHATRKMDLEGEGGGDGDAGDSEGEDDAEEADKKEDSSAGEDAHEDGSSGDVDNDDVNDGGGSGEDGRRSARKRRPRKD